MGCNIHGFIEVKDVDYWYAQIFEPTNDRYYVLFAHLAGVRNYQEIVPIAPPRGMPEEPSDTYKALVEKWEGDGHSHSWVSAREFLSLNIELYAHWGMFKEMMQILVGFYGEENVRFVFFFDN